MYQSTLFNEFKKNNFERWFPVSLFRASVIVFPALVGTEVAGIWKYFLLIWLYIRISIAGLFPEKQWVAVQFCKWAVQILTDLSIYWITLIYWCNTANVLAFWLLWLQIWFGPRWLEQDSSSGAFVCSVDEGKEFFSCCTALEQAVIFLKWIFFNLGSNSVAIANWCTCSILSNLLEISLINTLLHFAAMFVSWHILNISSAIQYTNGIILLQVTYCSPEMSFVTKFRGWSKACIFHSTSISSAVSFEGALGYQKRTILTWQLKSIKRYLVATSGTTFLLVASFFHLPSALYAAHQIPQHCA